MSFDEVKTLFHEFGHGLQAMLTSVDYSEVAGINGVEWDAVEIVSQFMENWCYHRPTLRSITRHIETGEHLPDELFSKLLEEKLYRAGSLMLKQLEYGLTDMQLHSMYDPKSKETPFDVHRRIVKQTDNLPPLKDDRLLCSFTHLFSGGYAAGYYSYKWSEVLSADIFAVFEEIGLENQEKLSQLGKKFRDTFLALGGSKHPMEVFKAFRGREPSTEALLRQNGLTIST
jgi:oligopeptidase A